MDRFTKKEARLIGRIWAGSQLRHLDFSVNVDADLDTEAVVASAIDIGKKILGKHPPFTEFEKILQYVKSIRKTNNETEKA